MTSMDMKLEVVVIPVADVDRAKAFYVNLGWRQDADFAGDNGFRVVQLTPPGSNCSIIFGDEVTTSAAGSYQGLQLIVDDIDQARAELVSKGVEASEVFHDAGGVFHHAGTDNRASGPAPEHKTYGSFVSFADPDGNTWFLQEVTTRLPGRVTQTTEYPSAPVLAEALRRAAAAHGQHEKEIGHRDENWPDWYAKFMVEEQESQK